MDDDEQFIKVSELAKTCQLPEGISSQDVTYPEDPKYVNVRIYSRPLLMVLWNHIPNFWNRNWSNWLAI